IREIDDRIAQKGYRADAGGVIGRSVLGEPGGLKGDDSGIHAVEIERGGIVDAVVRRAAENQSAASFDDDAGGAAERVRPARGEWSKLGVRDAGKTIVAAHDHRAKSQLGDSSHAGDRVGKTGRRGVTEDIYERDISIEGDGS